ncbi:MAG TPA: hypothetical protein VIH54_10685, partial [Chthoniobacterales bacterium]
KSTLAIVPYRNACCKALMSGGRKTQGESMKSLLSLAVGTKTALSLGIASHAQQYSQTNLVV